MSVLNGSGVDWDSMMDEMLAGVTVGGVSVEEAEDDSDVDVDAVDDFDASEYGDAVPESWGKAGVVVVNQPAVAVAVAVAPVVTQDAMGGNGMGFVPSGVNVSVVQRAVSSKGEGKVNLDAASRQWASRPADERFWNVGEMAAACQGFKDNSRELRVDLGRVQVVNDRGDMLLMGGGLTGAASFSHYSFGQLCRVAGAPADYLRDLDGELAAKCIETGLRKKDRDVLGGSGNVLVRGGLTTGVNQSVGAFLSGGYSRIWNADVVSRLGEFESRGWQVPPARPASFDDPRARKATEDDVLKNNKSGVAGGLTVKVGDLIAPAGLYASDRDCFAFMVLEGGVEIGGSVMNRGFFVSNSEVGDRAFSLTTFLYDAVCGNHIVWGASEVTEVRLVHRGRANTRWIGDLQRALQKYASNGTERERHLIMSAIGRKIADTRDAVVEKLFKDKRLGLTKKSIESAWDWSVKEARLRGNKFAPESVWGMVCGLTRVSQECGWADQRVWIDQAAGRLLGMAG